MVKTQEKEEERTEEKTKKAAGQENKITGVLAMRRAVWECTGRGRRENKAKRKWERRGWKENEERWWKWEEDATRK